MLLGTLVSFDSTAAFRREATAFFCLPGTITSVASTFNTYIPGNVNIGLYTFISVHKAYVRILCVEILRDNARYRT